MSVNRSPSAELLTGFRIGVTSDRRSEDLISALERRGATVLHAPALKIIPNDQDGQLVAETERLIEARPEVTLITTGYGMRRWLEVADAAGLGAELTRVLEDSDILARGPKALGAVRAAGLEEAGVSASETTASLVDRVIDNGWTDRRVAIQLHGYTDEHQLQRLREASREVLTVTPYRWGKPTGADRLPRLLRDVAARKIDAITFTSAPAVDATLAAARSLGIYDDVLDALRGDVLAAAVGPVTAGPLTDVGVKVIMPERFRMGALIRLVCDHLVEHRSAHYRTADGIGSGDGIDLLLRGSCLQVGARQVWLGPSARALFVTLADAESAVVPRAVLARSLPADSDDHALEAAISRLRRSLGIDDLIGTVVKRGYRMQVARLSLH